MGDKSRIEWTDATWNPVTGCSKVSPGCAHCYAESLALGKLKGMTGYPGLPWTPQNAETNVVLHPSRLDQPLKWTRPRMVFVNSMSDLFHEQIPDAFIENVFAVMALAPQHIFQVLTKRPERMKTLLNNRGFHINTLMARWRLLGIEDEPERRALFLARNPDHPIAQTLAWPLRNAWLGVSIENRRYVHRADLLRDTPAAVRFISAEPLLGALVHDAVDHGFGRELPAFPRSRWSDNVDLPQLDLTGIDWLIVGGESGPKHRPMRVEWVRDLRDACLVNASDLPHKRQAEMGKPWRIAFFFKQWGGRTPKAGGRLLDGRTWDETPR